MSGTKKTDLVNDLDDFFASLLEEARQDKVPAEGQPAEGAAPPIGFLDRLKLFEAGARWVAVKNKVDPEDSKDEFGRLTDRFHGRTRRGGAAPAAGAGGGRFGPRPAAPAYAGPPSPGNGAAAPAGDSADTPAAPE